jgi:hypothetical protein
MDWSRRASIPDNYLPAPAILAAIQSTALQSSVRIMKFQQLPMGTRFEYEGVVYCKIGPVSATAEQGGSRLIPRHAELRPLDGAVPAAPAKPVRQLDESVVLAAFETFFAVCLRQADESGRMQLAAARERFLAALK